MDWLKNNKYLLTLAGLFLAQFLLISPLGEFPINDDWVHAEMVQHWAETGSFRLNPFTGPLFYTQLIYGTVLSKIFGFSFTLLRISTLFISAGLIWGLFSFLKKYTKHESLAFLATLTLWFNPIVYSLTFTFMTDIPALVCLLGAIIAYYVGFTKHQPGWFWLGSVITILGFFIRQTTILLLPAAGLLALLRPTERKLRFFTAIIIPGLLAVGLYYWLHLSQLIGDGISLHEVGSRQMLIKHAMWWSIYTALYLALFTLPITVTTIKKNQAILYGVASTIGLTVTLWLHFVQNKTFPYVSNTINHYALGPVAETLSGQYLPLFPPLVWTLVSGLAGLSLGILSVTLWTIAQKKKFYTSSTAFIALFAVFFCGPLLLFTGFDRYFLPLLLALIIVLVLEQSESVPIWPGMIILLIVGFYSLSQTHFYLQWQQMRATLVTSAFKNHQAQIDTLDSGYEWVGYHNYWPSLTTTSQKRGPADSPWWIKFLVTNVNRKQVISTTPLPGYTTVEQRSVPGLNPNNRLYLLVKNDEPAQK